MASSSERLSSPPSDFHYDITNTTIPQTLWNLRVPLFITHKNSPDSPFIAAVPRLSYLAQLLPRLSSFFGVPCSSFHHEDIQLRNLAVGLLVDLYQPQLPWRLEVGDGDEWDIGDTYLNCVKEVSGLIPDHDCPMRKAARFTLILLFPKQIVEKGAGEPSANLGSSGRFRPKRQRQADHELVQGKHHCIVEFCPK